jgi:uncharacterized membrane protein
MPLYSYLFIFFIISACLILSLILQKCKVTKSYYLPFLLPGVLFVLIIYANLFLFCTIKYFWVPFAVAIIGIGGAVLCGAAAKAAGIRFFSDKLNLAILAAYLMGAASIVISNAIVFSINGFKYSGEDFWFNFLIVGGGTALIWFSFKFIFFFAMVWLLDACLKEEKADEGDLPLLKLTKNTIKFAVIILGITPAIVNSMRFFFGI